MNFKPRFSGLGRVQGDPALPALEDKNGGPAVRPRPLSLPSSTAPRRPALLRPLPLVGLMLALLALLGYVSAYSRAGQRTAVLIAARSLPAGTLLQAADLTSAPIAAGPSLLSALVTKAGEGSVLGRRLASSVAAGSPLPASAFGGRAGTPDSLTLSVLAQHAHGGDLVAGDRVTVLATYSNPNGSAQTRVVARSLEVLAVGQPPSGLGSASALLPVTVALPTPSLATALALANSQAKLDLLLQGGGSGSALIPSASEGAS
jgi:Flp pilus assembly protein CpaB